MPVVKAVSVAMQQQALPATAVQAEAVARLGLAVQVLMLLPLAMLAETAELAAPVVGAVMVVPVVTRALAAPTVMVAVVVTAAMPGLRAAVATVPMATALP